MNTYVVCMDSSWVRDSQMFDIAGLTDDGLAEIDGTIWSRPRLSQS